MRDPTGSIGRALWIGGGQWAGKSTVARLRPEFVVLLAQDAVAWARELGVRVLEVDGSRKTEEVAGQVADHFSPYL